MTGTLENIVQDAVANTLHYTLQYIGEYTGELILAVVTLHFLFHLVTFFTEPTDIQNAREYVRNTHKTAKSAAKETANTYKNAREYVRNTHKTAKSAAKETANTYKNVSGSLKHESKEKFGGKTRTQTPVYHHETDGKTLPSTDN